MRVAVILAGAAVAIGTAAPAPVRAQAFAPIEDRDFGLDLYAGAALGSVRIVGMGGAAIGTAVGSAGTLVNPAAATVRRTTSKGSWDWDFHVDALTAVAASDFDNNGVTASDEYGTRIETFGLAGMLGGWGAAATVTAAGTAIDGDAGDHLEARAISGKLAFARQSDDRQWTIGVAARIGEFEMSRLVGGGRIALFTLSGGGLEAGGLWRQPDGDLRVGITASLPITGANPAYAGCDPLDCEGYILPDRVEVPWQLAGGVAWRRAPTRWNQLQPGDYRDERALLLAADLVVTGGVRDGYGLEAFGQQVLQPSGRHPVVSLRAGAEYEWLPGRLRVRGGSYWEPGRFEGVGGRLHGTVGVEVALWQFCVWRWTYRVRVSVTGDVAARYGNAGMSVGFWH